MSTPIDLSFEFPSNLVTTLQVPKSLIPPPPVQEPEPEPQQAITVEYPPKPKKGTFTKKTTLSELRAACREAGLATTGSKPELLERLEAA